MSLLDRKLNIKIKNVQFMFWDKSSVFVAPRPYHALAFRAKGKAIFSHKKNTVFSQAGTITYMPANYSYHADYPEKNEIFVIHFDSDATLDLEIYNPFSSAAILTHFKNAYNIWNEGKQAYYFKTMSVFYEILASISAQTDIFYNSNLYKDFFNAIDYMKNNFTDSDITIEELAKTANMSNTYFRKLFFERFGENPSTYLTSLRLQYAEKLLSTGKYSVNETALLSGFNDPKYFSRVVKKIYGYPPSHLYR